MAKWFPMTPKNNYEGENKIFSLLDEYVENNESDTNNWYIFHSLNLASDVHRTQEMGEIDFLLIIPGYGVMILEVKGHRSGSYDKTQWILGNEIQLKSPFTQVADNKFSVQNFIYEKNNKFKNILFSHAVIFPFIDWNDIETVEWSDWQMIDKNKIESEDIGKLIKNIFINEMNLMDEKDKNKISLSKHDALSISNILCEDRYVYGDNNTTELLKTMNHITNKQLEFCQSIFQSNERVIIQGPAGTGKTIAAMNLARLHNTHINKILFSCYNSLLSNWVADKLKEYPNIYCSNIYKYIMSIIKKHEKIYEYPQTREEWDKLIEKASYYFIDNEYSQFEYIILDEAQDVLTKNTLEFFEIILRGGMNEGKWAFFGDFEYQDIYIDSNFHNNFHTTQLPLNENLRNPKDVGIYSELILNETANSLYKSYHNPTSKSVEFIKYIDEQDYIRKFDKLLNKLKTRGEIDHTTVLLQSLKNSQFLNFINFSKFQIDQLDSIENMNKLNYSTVHRFKGLESPIIILTDITRYDDYGKKLNYIAITRSIKKTYIFLEEGKERDFIE